jgi:hypothetical protein
MTARWEDPDITRWLRLHRLNERNREACDRLEREAAANLDRARRDLDLIAGAVAAGLLPVPGGAA